MELLISQSKNCREIQRLSHFNVYFYHDWRLRTITVHMPYHVYAAGHIVNVAVAGAVLR